jgi:hypothetical protein
MVNREANSAANQDLILWSSSQQSSHCSKQPSSYKKQVLINYHSYATNKCNFIPKENPRRSKN